MKKSAGTVGLSLLAVVLGWMMMMSQCSTTNAPIVTPVITSISPTSATAGGTTLTITITGSNFAITGETSAAGCNTGSVEGAAWTSTWAVVTGTQMTLTFPQSQLATGGTCVVSVLNSTGLGSSVSSNQPTFTLNNPVPSITSFSPASATAGAAAQTLTLNGTGFVTASTVNYNGAAHTPTFVSGTQLTIPLTAADQATAGSYPVVVTNPAPAGGASTAVNFTVNNPVPAITSLSPSSATAGAAAQKLTLNGTNFLSTSTVTYGGVAHAATFVSATQLTISLTAADQMTAGSFPVMATNPSPGGGASAAVNFTVNNPVPTVTSLSPSSATAGAAGQTLTVNGTNFLSTSTVTYNGVAHTATFVNASQLTISLTAADQMTAGSFPVVVTNPGPGGGSSGAVNYTVNAAAPPACGSGNEAALSGPYAFQLKGFNNSGFNAVVGSIVFNGVNGNGLITGGEVDMNHSGAASATNSAVASGTYSLGSDNRGCATIVTASGVTFKTRIEVGSLSASTHALTEGQIMEFDPASSSAFIAAGQIYQQAINSSTSGTFIGNGGYVHLLTGWDSTNNARLVCGGVHTNNVGSISGSEQTCNDAGVVTQSAPSGTVGTYSDMDASGRFTETTTATGETLVAYFISANGTAGVPTVFSLTTGGTSGNTQVLAGQAILQMGGPYSTASLTGSLVIYGTGAINSSSGKIFFAQATANGTGTLTINAYAEDDAGTWLNASPATTYGYAIDASGHTTLAPTPGADAGDLYMTATGAVYVGTDSGGFAGFVSFQAGAGTLTNASLQGTYFGGTGEVINQSVQAEGDLAILDGTGNVSLTSDDSSTSSLAPNQSSTKTVNIATNGTFTTSSHPAQNTGILIYGSSFLISNGVSWPYPTLLLFMLNQPAI